MTTMDEKDQELFDQIPMPDDCWLPYFTPLKIVTLNVPHPYCVTPGHVGYASDNWGGILSKKAIADAEKNGIASCEICEDLVRERRQPRVLSVYEHENLKTLVLSVKDTSDLNSLPGLKAYLFEIKELAEHLGIKGFAFEEFAQ